jgi:hypothetical protein
MEEYPEGADYQWLKPRKPEDEVLLPEQIARDEAKKLVQTLVADILAALDKSEDTDGFVTYPILVVYPLKGSIAPDDFTKTEPRKIRQLIVLTRDRAYSFERTRGESDVTPRDGVERGFLISRLKIVNRDATEQQDARVKPAVRK